MTSRLARLAAPAVAAATVLFVAADDASKTMKAGELSFAVPASWKAETPKSAMRKAQVKVAPAEGDADPAEMIVFQFPGGAGTVEANVDRWEKMFVDAEGKPVKATTAKARGRNVDVTRVEVAGRYIAAVMPGSNERNNKPDYRLLGAIVETPGAAYFFRMVGPDRTMKAARSGFDAMIASMAKE
jgi:hypothetical protein